MLKNTVRICKVCGKMDEKKPEASAVFMCRDCYNKMQNETGYKTCEICRRKELYISRELWIRCKENKWELPVSCDKCKAAKAVRMQNAARGKEAEKREKAKLLNNPFYTRLPKGTKE